MDFKKNAIWKIAAFVLGGVGGYLFGSFASSLFFYASDDMITVVKLGPGAFWTTLKAGLIGGVSAGLLVGLISSFMTQETSKRPRLIVTGAVIGIAIAITSAYIATSP